MTLIRLDYVIKVLSEDLGADIPNEKLGQILEHIIALADKTQYVDAEKCRLYRKAARRWKRKYLELKGGAE